LTDRRLLVFLLSVTLFHFANAAMLPLVGQRLAAGHPHESSLWMAACIITAQVVMVPVAALSGVLAGKWGRKRTFLTAMCVLPIRGILYTLTDNPLCLVAVQILDGIAAAAFGVISILVVSDLTKNTGRFNFVLGTVLGAAIAAIAIAIFWCFMPETLPGMEKLKQQ
jgi:MFS family permease